MNQVSFKVAFPKVFFQFSMFLLPLLFNVYISEEPDEAIDFKLRTAVWHNYLIDYVVRFSFLMVNRHPYERVVLNGNRERKRHTSNEIEIDFSVEMELLWNDHSSQFSRLPFWSPYIIICIKIMKLLSKTPFAFRIEPECCQRQINKCG